MSQVTDQQTEDAQFGVAVTLWDAELSWASQRLPGDTRDNGGCPPGYGCIYGTNGNFCRLVSTATAVQIQQDTAPGLVDQTTINVAAAAGAVVGGAQQVVGAGKNFIEWLTGLAANTVAGATAGLWPWLVAGGLVYLYMVGGFETGRRATSYVSSRIPEPRARPRVSSKSPSRRRR